MKKQISDFLFRVRPYVFLPIYLFDKFLGNSSLITIFCYHGVSSEDWKFNVSFEDLKKHVEYLEKNYKFIELSDVEKFLAGKKKITEPSVVITFDDGYKDILEAATFFKKKGIKPTLFALSDTINPNRFELDNNKNFLTIKEIQNLKKSGWTIGSHSKTHADFFALSKEQIQQEIIGSKKELEKTLKSEIKYFAYPKGRYTEEVLKTVKKAGYRLALSMDSDRIDKKTSIYTVPRIGVDRTHSLNEFRMLFIPSVVATKKLIKNSPFKSVI